MLGKLTAALIAALTLLGATVSTPALAATALTGVSMTLLADDVVQGVDVPKARISVTPPVAAAAVQVQRLQTVDGVRGWRTGGTITTHAGGLVTVRFTLPEPGTYSWRAVTTRPDGTRVASPVRIVIVHSATPVAGDTVGPDLLALEHALCLRVSGALASAPPAGVSESTGVRTANPFTQRTVPAARCANRAFAASIWADFTAALTTSVVGSPLEVGTQSVWRPVVRDILKQTRRDAKALGAGALTLFARLLAKDQAKADDAYAECLRDAGSAPGQAARVKQCLRRARAASRALTKAQLKRSAEKVIQAG